MLAKGVELGKRYCKKGSNSKENDLPRYIVRQMSGLLSQ